MRWTTRRLWLWRQRCGGGERLVEHLSTLLQCLLLDASTFGELREIEELLQRTHLRLRLLLLKTAPLEERGGGVQTLHDGVVPQHTARLDLRARQKRLHQVKGHSSHHGWVERGQSLL